MFLSRKKPWEEQELVFKNVELSRHCLWIQNAVAPDAQRTHLRDPEIWGWLAFLAIRRWIEVSIQVCIANMVRQQGVKDVKRHSRRVCAFNISSQEVQITIHDRITYQTIRCTGLFDLV